MKDKSKTSKIILLILVLTILNLSFVLADCSNAKNTAILDISDVDVAFGTNGFKNYIKVTALANAARADCLEIQWTKDQINSELKESGYSEDATKDITGWITLDEFKRSYKIFDSNSYYYAFNTKDYCAGSLAGCTIDTCKNILGSTGEPYPYDSWINAAYSEDDFSKDENRDCGWYYQPCICVKNYKRAESEYWGGTQTDFRKLTIGFDGLGSKTVSGNPQIPQVEFFDAFGNKKAFVQWDFDVNTGTDFDVRSSGYFPVQDLKTQERYMIFGTWLDNVKTESYNIWVNDLRQCYGKDWDCMYLDIIGREGDFYFPELQRQSIEQIKDENPLLDDVSIDGQTANFDFSGEPLTRQQFTILLDAEWAGIRKMVAKPRLECPDYVISVKSGVYENIPIKVFNDADNAGNILASVKCKNNALLTINPSNYGLDAHSSEDGIVQAAFTVLGDNQYLDCVVTAVDGTDSSIKDECTLKFEILSPKCTTPGETKCSGDLTQLLTCSTEGQWMESECPFGCLNGKCADQPPNCPTSCSKDGDCISCSENKETWACVKNRCIKKPVIGGCESCWSWLYSKALKSGEYCAATSVYEFKIGDIIGWHIGPNLISISQDDWCPLVLITIFMVALIIVSTIILVIKYYRRKHG